MKNATLILDRDYSIGRIDPRVYGSIIEHLGRAVYGGIFEPGHPSADENGFRRDVMELVRRLQVPIVRYPGGNFVSGYHFMDGIGPRKQRPKRLDLAWASVENNQFGIDEFADWCKAAGTSGMIAVNLGTGSPEEAAQFVEYCNHPGGTELSDLRRQNGHPDPHDFRVWCLGNEMDGPWQICHMEAHEYGRKALEAAKMMKWVDPSIELVVCGSSNSQMPTYPDWDREALEITYSHVDYLSMHRYYALEWGKEDDYIGSFRDMDLFIRTLAATADYVQAKRRGKKRIMLSFDEWNIWHSTDSVVQERWTEGPPIVEQHNMMIDALAVGGLLCSLINHSDRVRMACLAQLVNVLAPILTENGGTAVAKPSYYPFMHASVYGRGEALGGVYKGPMFDTGKAGDAPIVQTAAVLSDDGDELTVFALNCGKDETTLSIDARAMGALTPIGHIELKGDLYASNTFTNPENIVPVQKALSAGVCSLAGRSWNVLRYKVGC